MNKIRTLIVDDEALARERLWQLLQNEPGVEIIGECANGREAVEVIGKKLPELIFLDVQMPELDGFGVLEALSTQAAPVINVTSPAASAPVVNVTNTIPPQEQLPPIYRVSSDILMPDDSNVG